LLSLGVTAAHSEPCCKIVEIASVHAELSCRSGPVAVVSRYGAADEISLKILHQLAKGLALAKKRVLL
jgi:hypothetical protein